MQVSPGLPQEGKGTRAFLKNIGAEQVGPLSTLRLLGESTGLGGTLLPKASLANQLPRGSAGAATCSHAVHQSTSGRTDKVQVVEHAEVVSCCLSEQSTFCQV